MPAHNMQEVSVLNELRRQDKANAILQKKFSDKIDEHTERSRKKTHEILNNKI